MREVKRGKPTVAISLQVIFLSLLFGFASDSVFVKNINRFNHFAGEISFIVRFFVGFALDSVFVKLNKNIDKY